jgi:tetratricopeptide (TPR) repeat protein
MLVELGAFSAALAGDANQPDSPEVKAHLDQSRAFFAKGQYDEAAKELQAAGKIDPKNFDVFMTSGEFLSRLHDYDRAEGAYHSATKSNPKSPEAWNNRGVAFAAQGKYLEAAACFSIAVDLNPMFEAANKNLEAARKAGKQSAPATQPTTQPTTQPKG